MENARRAVRVPAVQPATEPAGAQLSGLLPARAVPDSLTELVLPEPL
jgi:hypothetical protein